MSQCKMKFWSVKAFATSRPFYTKPYQQVFSRSLSLTATDSKLSIRLACSNDMNYVTRQSIKEGWHIGPYDFPNRFAFDPKSSFIGEIDKKPVGYVCAVNYPNHHFYMQASIVAKEHRGKGYGKQLFLTSYGSCDKHYTIGADVYVGSRSKTLFEASGFQTLWSTHTVTLSLEKIAQKLRRINLPFQVTIVPTTKVTFMNLLEYDSFIFGTVRRKLVEKRITTPGSFGLVAVKDGNIAGYSILRQVISGSGTEIGLAMAPLFADNVHIAKALIKTAAEKCLANEAVPKTKLALLHPVGNNCGEGSSELIEELEAKLTHIAFRMYSKGIPPGRKIEKIYGVASD